jgi:hypothetical protein
MTELDISGCCRTFAPVFPIVTILHQTDLIMKAVIFLLFHLLVLSYAMHNGNEGFGGIEGMVPHGVRFPQQPVATGTVEGASGSSTSSRLWYLDDDQFVDLYLPFRTGGRLAGRVTGVCNHDMRKQSLLTFTLIALVPIKGSFGRYTWEDNANYARLLELRGNPNKSDELASHKATITATYNGRRHVLKKHFPQNELITPNQAAKSPRKRKSGE